MTIIETPKLLNRAGTGMSRPVGTSVVTVYTVPADGKAIIKKGIAVNYTDADVELTIWHVESGTSQDDDDIIFCETIPKKTAVLIDVLGIIENLGTADTLRAQCDTVSSLNIILYGTQITET